MGLDDEARAYFEQAKQTDTARGIPELYYSNSDAYNENTPLGWSESLFVVALHEVNDRRLKGKENKRPA